jgi:SAM-dependent methyltransferase
MGYSPHYFTSYVGDWITRGWLPTDGKFIDFGSQEFHGDEAEARRETTAFLRERGLSEAQIMALVPPTGMPAVADIFRAVGIDYRSIDVDGARGAEYFDLNCFAAAPEQYGAFDFVNNEGTIEHLVNPINGFQVAHEFLKVGGVARHSMPLTGWQNHGYFCTTMKFHTHLMDANHYEFLVGKIFIYPSDTTIVEDPRFSVVDRNGATLKELPPMSEAAVYLMYRKTSDRAFQIPSDLPEGMRGFGRLARKLSRNFDVAAKGRAGWSDRGAINWLRRTLRLAPGD